VFSRKLRADLANEIKRGCDILHLEGLWSGWIGLSHPECALLNLHYLFEIDLASAPVAGITGHALKHATRRGERRLLRHYPHIATLTPRLSARVRQIAPSARVHTVPIALDLTLYPFNPAVPERPIPIVTLIGSFNWYPTRTAGFRLVEQLWPLIRDRVPEASLRLVGRHAKSVLGRFSNMPGVSIHDSVPDIVPYFTESDVMLYAPTEGSGMKVKVLEAFALGAPVVTTPDGVEGIPAVDGVHAGIAADDEGLVERAVALLSNPALQIERRLAARALLEEYCAPSRILGILQNVYGSIIGVT
jgi:glycosyltransferase involved in cell wall biosynthesis